MGLHYHLKYLVTIFVTHVILHCFAVDLGRNNFRGLQHGQMIRKRDQYSFNNADEERDSYNKITSPKHWNWNKSLTAALTTATPLSKGVYVSLTPRYLSKSSTPSFIEFDYLNLKQRQDHSSMKSLERFVTNNGMPKVNHSKTCTDFFLGPSIISYHHDPYMRQELITTQKAFFPKYPHMPLYSYFQTLNNSDFDIKGKPKNKLNVRDAIINTPLLGQKTYKVKEYLKSSPGPTRTSMSDSISNIPVLSRKVATVKAYFKSSRVPTRTSTSDSTSNIPVLSRKTATVKAYFKSSRVPTRTTMTVSTTNIPVLERKAATVKAYFKSSRMPTRTSTSDSTSNIPILSRKAATVKAYLKSSRVPTRRTNGSAPKSLIQFTRSRVIAVSTASDDRVKFFEMYDTNTLKSPKKIKLDEGNNIEMQLNDIMSEKMEQNGHRNKNLGRFDDTNVTKMDQKYNYKFRRSNKGDSNSAISNKIQGKNDRKSLPMSIVNNTVMFPSDSIFSKSEIMTKTAVVPWSTYPFASVYVYKPTQTHCDAAGISPHWLLAAGSCLSRHTLVHSLHARSAFVTYCGEHWRRPQRVAYVKRSVVHPKFNPRDQVRRLLYNIGLIQVSDSMDACPGWSPALLMSHQFLTQSGGSIATAVGWGLDRYGTKHMTEKLPHWPLTMYGALVYHDTCPGSSAYSTAKRQDGDGTSNMYCLLLPPYTKEESDPVHGGLLLVEGKLVALYLQEERRPWGPQSAQYTGVWRLLPWVMEVAREPDDGEAAFDV